MTRNNTQSRLLILAVSALVPLAVPYVAAGQSTPRSDCEMAAPTEAPTKSDKGPDSGSKNMGSTGWTGAKDTDTTDAGPTPGSPTEHPATAKGLDPKPDATGLKPC